MFGKHKAAETVGRRSRSRLETDKVAPSKPVFSYYTQGSYQSDTANRRDRVVGADTGSARRQSIFGRYRILLLVLTIFMLAAAVYFSLLSPTPKIVLVQDRATSYFLQDTSVYQQAAEQALGASIFNRSKLTIDTNAVRLAMLQHYPEIHNVSIVMPILGRQPQLFIEPYKPSFLLTTTSSNAFLLDATGRALASASQITDVDKLHVPTLQDHSGIPVKLGSRALPSTTVSFVQSVVAALQAQAVTPASLVLPPAAFELDVSINGDASNGGAPYFVKFNLQNDALQQAGTYLATRQRLAADHTRVGQYIDVRVPERAYYK